VELSPVRSRVVEFRVLGPLVVVDDGGAEVPIKGSRLRSLLALLVLHAGDVVSADRVADELWGDDLPSDATAALQTQVSRLRAALRARGLDGYVQTRKPGYVLDVDPDSVDAHRFEAAVRKGRALLEAGEPAAASDVLVAALALWRGDLLADLADEHLAEAEHARLHELRRLAVEDRADADLAAGRHDAIVGQLQGLVAAEPLRERRTAQLMLALYRSGRQADALRAYQATRDVLREELGIEPGAELRRLELAVLAQDAELDAPRPAVERSGVQTGAAPAPSPHRIPAPLARLIGRDEELARLDALVADHRLVTLVGPGGVGKTRLAVEVGRRAAAGFADGAAMVELAAVEDPTAVVGAVARAVDADEPRDPGTAADLLADLLDESELLVLLDNCEHVIDEVARLVTTLLGRCPRLTILATSRQGFGIPGEVAMLLPSLERSAAVALFAERAGAAATGFVVDDGNQPAVEEVCERLDDMPLAIELAASRLRVFSPAQLAAGLDDRFRVVAGGARGALPRQQTLRAVVDWSYDLLDDEERRVFERFSVFAGGCTLEAAEAVCGGGSGSHDTGDRASDGPGRTGVIEVADVAGVLGRLVDKSLVVATPFEDGVRFTMLQTLIQYGRERLAGTAAEAEGARRRLACWLLDQAREGEAHVGETRLSFALRFGRELDNLRVGLAWAVENEPALAVETATRLLWFWFFNDAYVDGFRALSQGLAQHPDLPDDLHVRALNWGGLMAAAVGEVELGDRWGAEAVERARRVGDPVLIGRTACFRAERLVDHGRLDEAAPLFAEARRCLDGTDDIGLAYLDLREAIAASYAGDAARAYELSVDALERFRRIGDIGLLIASLQCLGECADASGRGDEASAALDEALALNEGLPGIGRRSQLLSRLVAVRVHQGRVDEALALAEENLLLARRQTWGYVTGLAFQARGRALTALGRFDEAAADLGSAAERLDGAGFGAVAESVRRELDEVRAAARG
jgi:predicted ATPase/DNA-binding SARP family transcriptional activator